MNWWKSLSATTQIVVVAALLVAVGSLAYTSGRLREREQTRWLNDYELQDLEQERARANAEEARRRGRTNVAAAIQEGGRIANEEERRHQP